MIDNMALMMVAAMMIGLGVLKLALTKRDGYTEYEPDAYGMCAPARYDSYTAAPTAAPRRIVAELAPPAGWREGELIVILPTPAVYEYDDDPDDEPLAVVVVPDLEPFAVDDWPTPAVVEPEPVPNWPTRQPIEQPEPVPVVVNRTAARFGALELNGRGNHG